MISPQKHHRAKNIQAQWAHERGYYLNEDSDHLRAVYELHHESFKQQPAIK